MRNVTPILLGAVLTAAQTQAKVPENFDKNLLTKSIQATLSPYDKAQPAPTTSQSAATTVQPAQPGYSLAGYSLASYQGFPSHLDTGLGSVTFLWVNDKTASASRKTAALTEENIQAAARAVLTAQSTVLGLDAQSLQDAELTELHDVGQGPLIARFKQKYQGLDVIGRHLNVLMDRQLNPTAISGYFAKVPPAGNRAPTSNAQRSSSQGQQAQSTYSQFSQTPETSIAAAFADLTEQTLDQTLSKGGERNGMTFYIPASGQSSWQLAGEVPVKKVYFAEAGRLVPAYRIVLRALGKGDDGGERWFNYIVAADTNTILARNNIVAHAAVSYKVWADADGRPLDGPQGNDLMPLTIRDPQLAPAVEPVPQRMVTLAHGPISTQDPWLAPNATTTKGNNVYALLDLAGTDGYDAQLADIVPAMTAPGVFDHPIAAYADTDTTAARNAAGVNLFYTLNWLHDDWYDNGFNEAAGNAQLDNYGRGGKDDDPIWAHGMDMSGLNNANMATPPDGLRPRMQMYLWSGENTGALEIKGLGSFDFGSAQFGPGGYDVAGQLAWVDDGEGQPSDGCSLPVNAAELKGKIAVIDQGNCNFVYKVAYAQHAGAIGALVLSNDPTRGNIDMAKGVNNDFPDVHIPAMYLSVATAAALRFAMSVPAAEVRMHKTNTYKDGTLDNDIIAHEFFHYVSNRLIGDGGGLITAPAGGLGEGWSDFASLLNMVRPEDRLVAGNDKFQGPYSVGAYTQPSSYFGIRRAPYSTDLSVNPLTFIHMKQWQPLPDTAPLAYGHDGELNGEVHATGEIWANMLWEVYAALLNDSRYSFEQARERMQDYLIASLKMTPLYPTFIEARDAMLAVAAATDAQDFNLMANAFAKRGIGVGAVGPHRDDPGYNRNIIESYVGVAAVYQVADSQLNYQFDDGQSGYCTNDNVLDSGETAELTVRLQISGNLPVTAPVKATLSTASDVQLSLADAGNLTFPLPDKNGYTSATTRFTLQQAATAAELDLVLSFADHGKAQVMAPAPVHMLSHVNFDLAPAGDTDDIESAGASLASWSADPSNHPLKKAWAVTDIGGNQAWHSPSSATFARMGLTTPAFVVADGAELQLQFDHKYEFEYYNAGEGPDGGVLQISVNNSPFTNVDYAGGQWLQGGYNGGFNLESFESSFTGISDETGALRTDILSMGSDLGGKTVRFRFLNVSDGSVAMPGWTIDNVRISGAASTPFSKTVANTPGCDPRPLHVSAGPDQTVAEHNGNAVPAQIKLTGTLRSQDGIAGVTTRWEQITGPAVTLSNINDLNATFAAPNVTADTLLEFRLAATKGAQKVEDAVAIRVTAATEPPPPPPPPPPPAPEPARSGGSFSLFWLLLALPLGWLRHRRGQAVPSEKNSMEVLP